MGESPTPQEIERIQQSFLGTKNLIAQVQSLYTKRIDEDKTPAFFLGQIERHQARFSLPEKEAITHAVGTYIEHAVDAQGFQPRRRSRLRTVLQRQFGLYDGKALPLKDIGDLPDFQVGKKRVEQLSLEAMHLCVTYGRSIEGNREWNPILQQVGITEGMWTPTVMDIEKSISRIKPLIPRIGDDISFAQAVFGLYGFFESFGLSEQMSYFLSMRLVSLYYKKHPRIARRSRYIPDFSDIFTETSYDRLDQFCQDFLQQLLAKRPFKTTEQFLGDMRAIYVLYDDEDDEEEHILLNTPVLAAKIQGMRELIEQSLN